MVFKCGRDVGVYVQVPKGHCPSYSLYIAGYFSDRHLSILSKAKQCNVLTILNIIILNTKQLYEGL